MLGQSSVAALGAFLLFFLPPFTLAASLETELSFKMMPTIFQGEKQGRERETEIGFPGLLLFFLILNTTVKNTQNTGTSGLKNPYNNKGCVGSFPAFYAVISLPDNCFKFLNFPRSRRSVVERWYAREPGLLGQAVLSPEPFGFSSLL